MPKLVLSLPLALISFSAIAQENAQPWRVVAVYAQSGFLKQWSLPVDEVWDLQLARTYGATVLFRNGVSGALHLRSFEFNGRNTPPNYRNGVNTSGRFRPSEGAGLVAVQGGYKWHPFRSSLFRASAEAGPAAVLYNRAHFTPKAPSPEDGRNYFYEHRIHTFPAVASAVRIEAPVSRYAGLEAGFWYVINAELPLAGAEISATIGVVRHKRRARESK